MDHYPIRKHCKKCVISDDSYWVDLLGSRVRGFVVYDCCRRSLSSKMSQQQRSRELSLEGTLRSEMFAGWQWQKAWFPILLMPFQKLVTVSLIIFERSLHFTFMSVPQMIYLFWIVLCITSTNTALYTGLFSSCTTSTHTQHTHMQCSYRPLLHAMTLPLVGLLAVWWRGDTPALRIHPAVYVVSDVASGDPTHRTHWHGQLLASLQHLYQQRRVKLWKWYLQQTSWPHTAMLLL